MVRYTTGNMEVELDNCPFCGGEAEVNEPSVQSYSFQTQSEGWFRFFEVRCDECPASMRGSLVEHIYSEEWYAKAKYIVDKWNKRAY